MTRVRSFDDLPRRNRGRDLRAQSRPRRDDRDGRSEARREADQDPRRKPLIRFSGLLLIAGVAIGLLSLRVNRIEVEGAYACDAQRLRKVLAPCFGQRLLLIDRGRLSQELREDPWIDHAEIHRGLPAKLRVVLHESEAVFRLSGDGQERGAVDRNGRMLPPKEGLLLSHLPVLQDVQLRPEDGQLAAADRQLLAALVRALRQVPWTRHDSLAEVRLHSFGGIELVTTGDLRLRLGTDGFARHLRAFAAAAPQLDPQPGDQIDLRFERQVVLAPADRGRKTRGG